MATVPHVTSGLGLRKFQADGYLLTRVYIACLVVKLSLWLNWGFGIPRVLRCVARCLVPNVSGQRGCLIFRVRVSSVE